MRLSTATRAAIIAQIDELSAEEMLELLKPQVRDTLTAEFIKEFDANDLEEIVFLVMDGSDRLVDKSHQIHLRWVKFLEMRKLREKHSDEIEEQYLTQHGEE